MPNRLADQTSPYLLQHADNPVDWYPWGAEAFERARREDKPVLLSIGYAACHWCHVMAHESFEDADTARVMNELFVNVKVDREERPDVDGIYMQAVQAMTGHGGWPMTVFLTPDAEPFYGGTYFPPADRHGLPSFTKVLRAVAEAYRERREGVTRAAEQLREIYRAAAPAAPRGQVDARALDLAFRRLAQQYDARHGGFGGAPKFPPAMALDFLLRYWRRTGTEHALEIVQDTFRHMAAGGIYDHVGGGFARYSVDAFWLVPHFEKMLYDNALLTRLAVHLWRATRDSTAERVVRETMRWLSREMTAPDGGFYSSLDADSEGEEGKFYVWDERELDELLGADAALAKAFFGVTAGGNFEGKNILHTPAPIEVVAARNGAEPEAVAKAVARAKDVLYEARARRVWPGRDEKILASWNGLMLRACAEAAAAFDTPDWRALTVRSAEFIERELVRDGRVWRVHKDGRTHTTGFLEDQAAVALAFLAVYGLTFDVRWFRAARRCCDVMVELFHDANTGVFYDTAHDAERLITRPRDVTDNAIPAGNSLAAELLLTLGELTGEERYGELGRQIVAQSADAVSQYPTAFGHLLGAADMAAHGGVQVAVVGEPGTPAFEAMRRVVAEEYVPSLVLAGGAPASEPALLRGRSAPPGEATAYVCRAFTCELPAPDADTLRAKLAAAGSIVSSG